MDAFAFKRMFFSCRLAFGPHPYPVTSGFGFVVRRSSKSECGTGLCLLFFHGMITGGLVSQLSKSASSFLHQKRCRHIIEAFQNLHNISIQIHTNDQFITTNNHPPLPTNQPITTNTTEPVVSSTLSDAILTPPPFPWWFGFPRHGHWDLPTPTWPPFDRLHVSRPSNSPGNHSLGTQSATRDPVI